MSPRSFWTIVNGNRRRGWQRAKIVSENVRQASYNHLDQEDNKDNELIQEVQDRDLSVMYQLSS